MKRGFPVLSGLMNGFVKLLFAAIVLYLTLLAGFSTAAVSDAERSFLYRDSMAANLLCEAAFLAALALAGRLFMRRYPQERTRDAAARRISRGLMIAMGVLAALLVLTTQRLPNADQRQVFECVRAIVQHDPAPFEPGGYLEMYPYQSGIIWFTYAVSRLFGMENYLVFQCLNALCLLWILKSFLEIADTCGGGSVGGTICMVLSLLFVPLLLYVNFIYGTLIGLALMLSAFRHARRFSAGESGLQAALAVLLALGAVIVKTNYLIYLIGLILWLGVEWIRTGRNRIMPLVAALVVVLAGSGSLSRSLLESASGRQLGKGVNSLAWVAMGLSENSEKYDGWWNHYTNGTYRSSGFDNAAQGEAAKEEIGRRLSDFAGEPRRAVKFFSGKNASQWNNPDFQSYCFFRFMGENGRLTPTRFVYRLFTVEWGARIHGFLNFVQFVILCGVLLFLVLTPFSGETALYGEIVVIGGMLFHTVWEAKSQYTLTYFLLFLPVSAAGYAAFLRRVTSAKGEFPRPGRRALGCAAFLALSVLVIGSRRFSLLNNLFMRGEDRAAYEEYLAANTFVRVPEGRYRLRPALRPESCLTLREDGALFGNETGGSTLFLSWPDTSDDVLIAGGQGLCLASPGLYPREGQAVTAAAPSDSADERWHLVRAGQPGEYCIVFREGYVLTLEEDGTPVLRAMAFDDAQRFKLEAAGD